MGAPNKAGEETGPDPARAFKLRLRSLALPPGAVRSPEGDREV